MDEKLIDLVKRYQATMERVTKLTELYDKAHKEMQEAWKDIVRVVTEDYDNIPEGGKSPEPTL